MKSKNPGSVCWHPGNRTWHNWKENDFINFYIFETIILFYLSMRGVHSFRGFCPLENMLLSRDVVLPPCFKWSHCSWLLASNFRVWAKMRMLSTTDEACHSTWYHTVKLIKTGYFYGRQELGKTLTKNHVRSIKKNVYCLRCNW